MHADARDLGIDPGRLVVAGESAGGGHAAMLAIAARDRGEIAVRGQYLIYPMLDDRTGSTVFPPPHQGAFLWRPQDNRLGWTSFLGTAAGSARVPAGAVPARVDDLRGLPPTFIGVGALDLFAEENVIYANRMMAAGVPTELYVAPGAYHGFDIFVPEAGVSRTFGLVCDRALKRLLAPA
jgi:acetyl esterase/lipase